MSEKFVRKAVDENADGLDVYESCAGGKMFVCVLQRLT